MEVFAELLAKIERLAPQWFLAVVAIFIAIGFMVYNQPPHELCDTQKRAFIEKQRKFLASSQYNQFFERCLKTNNRGACEPYFIGFEKVMNDFKVVDPICLKPVANMKKLKSSLTSFLVQVTRIAWGDQGPETIYKRSSWLAPTHLRVFCRVKSSYKRFYGEVAYEGLVNKVLKILPNERRLTAVQKKERSLFTTPCSQYF